MAVLSVAGAMTLVVSGVAFGARRTTNPGLAPVTAYVIETDKGITYSMWQSFVEEGQPAQVVASELQRGEVVTFQVTNKGKRLHDFAAFGKTTPKLKPGAKAHFKVALIQRGTFAYRSTLDKGKRGFSGVFRVY